RIRRGFGERHFFTFQIGGRLDRAVGRDNDFHFIAKLTAGIAHNRKRDEAGAIDRDWVRAGIKSSHMQRPERIASISAALDCTGKKTTFFPVFSSMYLTKPSQALAYTAGSSTGV